TTRGCGARGFLVTPHDDVDQTATDRLDRVRLLNREIFVVQVQRLIEILREYRRGWDSDAASRAERRAAVAPEMPTDGWLWRAAQHSEIWVDQDTLDATWHTPTRA